MRLKSCRFTAFGFCDLGVLWEETCEAQQGFILVLCSLLCFLISIRKKFLCAKHPSPWIPFAVMHHQTTQWMSQKTMTICNNMYAQKCCRGVRHFYTYKVLVASPSFCLFYFYLIFNTYWNLSSTGHETRIRQFPRLFVRPFLTVSSRFPILGSLSHLR